MARLNDYMKYVEDSIESISPYRPTDPRYKFYFAGFLSAFIAQLIKDDSANFVKFKRHIEKIRKLNQ